MEVRNSTLLNPAQGKFSTLELVSFRLPGPYLWHCEDIDNETAKGSIFRAYQPNDGKDQESVNVAAITIADVTNDPDEPDIPNLEQDHIPALDIFLRDQIQSQLTIRGAALHQWMSSHLNQSDSFKGLVTAYITEDHGNKSQIIALRINVKGRKVAVIGQFDVELKEDLALPIFNMIRNITLIH